MIRKLTVVVLALWLAAGGSFGALAATPAGAAGPPIPSGSRNGPACWPFPDFAGLDYQVRACLPPGSEPAAFVESRSRTDGATLRASLALTPGADGAARDLRVVWSLASNPEETFNVVFESLDTMLSGSGDAREAGHVLRFESSAGTFRYDSRTGLIDGWAELWILRHPLYLEAERWLAGVMTAAAVEDQVDRRFRMLAPDGRTLEFSALDSLRELGFLWFAAGEALRAGIGLHPEIEGCASDAPNRAECDKCCEDLKFWGMLLCSAGSGLVGVLAGAGVAATGIGGIASGYIGWKTGATALLACAGVVMNRYNACLTACESQFRPGPPRVKPVSFG